MLFVIIGVALLALPCAGARQPAVGRNTTIVDVDLATGKTRVTGLDAAVRAEPGSTLKPIVLLTALRLGVVTPQTRVACAGTLRLAGRNLACTHPNGLGVLNAEEALAYSCNSYFTRIAERLPPAALSSALRSYGIDVAGSPGQPAERAFMALGLGDISVTPLQLAHAYVRLAGELATSSLPASTVRAGLFGSVTYGMAHAAGTPGVVLGGKTGTAHDPAPRMQHGWFAGVVFAGGKPDRPRSVVVVYSPGGTGNEAAAAAHQYLQGRRW